MVVHQAGETFAGAREQRIGFGQRRIALAILAAFHEDAGVGEADPCPQERSRHVGERVGLLDVDVAERVQPLMGGLQQGKPARADHCEEQHEGREGDGDDATHARIAQQ
nr:hypothetical protein [Verticiella sp. GG226]